MYYLRTRPKADAIQFTVDKSTLAAGAGEAAGQQEEEEECLTCSA